MSKGYAQIAIHNGEAYELTNEEFLELERRTDEIGVDVYHPLYFKTVYEYLLELGYEVDPPHPDLVPKKEDQAQVPTVSADTRQKAWNKEKILREQSKLNSREKKLLEREKQLDEALNRLKEDADRGGNGLPSPIKSRFKPTGNKGLDRVVKLVDDLAIYHNTQKYHRSKFDAEMNMRNPYFRYRDSVGQEEAMSCMGCLSALVGGAMMVMFFLGMMWMLS